MPSFGTFDFVYNEFYRRIANLPVIAVIGSEFRIAAIGAIVGTSDGPYCMVGNTVKSLIFRGVQGNKSPAGFINQFLLCIKRQGKTGSFFGSQ